MNHRRWILAISIGVTLMAAVAFFMVSKSYEPTKKKPFRVLVIHSYDQDYYAYQEFDEVILKTLKHENVNADVHNLYLSLIYPSQTGSDILRQARKEMDSQAWHPDVIITEGDRSVSALLNHGNDSILHELRTVPTIAAAVHHPDWDKLRNRYNFVVYTDPIDYCTNIDLAQEFSGVNFVEVELDRFEQDVKIREELRRAIARRPYVDNTDLHDRRLSEEARQTVWKDSTMVLAISAASPESNISDATTLDGKSFITNIYKYAYRYPSVVFKRDIYSQIIAQKTNKPQFTGVKAGFANGKGAFLCGYFAGYETVAKDVARSAAKLSRGEDYRSGNHQHQKNLFMDYAAMKDWGLEYANYSDRFVIVGAPYYVRHPYLFVALIVLGLLVAAVLTIILAQLIIKVRLRGANKLRHELEEQREIITLALHDTEARTLTSINDIEEIISRLDEKGQAMAPAIRQKYTEEGTHIFRLFFALNDNDEEEWWQMRFAVAIDNNGNPLVSGLLRNISQLVETEHEIELAHQKASEAKDKRMLIRNMTSAINAPLSTILQSSDDLVNDSKKLSDEEKQEVCKRINSSNAELMAIINDILSFSRLESRKTEYLMALQNARDVCEEVYNEWVDKMPPGVSLLKNYGRKEAKYWGDATHTKEILMQFMSNAVKFTKEDSISIGYKTHLSEGKTQLFVEDAGSGIPLDKRETIFNAFYKGDVYISGVGLGLNIATLLATGMGSRIQVSSELGIGSKFSIKMPSEDPKIYPPRTPIADDKEDKTLIHVSKND